MITDDLNITRPDYWDRIYQGRNDNARVDASNNKRPAIVFDRFQWVADQAEGPNILGVASGHAHIEKRIMAAHPEWCVVASDQAPAAIPVAKFRPYWILDAYHLPFFSDGFPNLLMETTKWHMIIIAQAMEYLQDDRHFLFCAAQVAHKILITLPLGEMAKWSQLRIYTEENVKDLLQSFGEIEFFHRVGDLLLIKLKFAS